MSISTKKGDTGFTGLLFGHRVSKTDLRVDANGTIDELNSFLGLAKAATRKRWVRDVVHQCQYDLFIVGSEIAALPNELSRLHFRIDGKRLAWIEKQAASLERNLKLEACCFLISGVNQRSALFDVCRTVARRAERLAVALLRKRQLPNKRVLAYLNRLSDLLWLIARAEEQKHVRFVAKK